MKKILFVIAVIGAICMFPVPIHTAIALPQHVTQERLVAVETRPRPRQQIVRGDLAAFMRAIAKIESGHDAKAVNRYGMMGKYQFSPSTLRGLGITQSREEFLNDEALQDEAMIRYIKENRRVLRRVIQQFANNRIIDGVSITESGILAGAHLTGVGGVLSYFYPERYTHRTSDANGATIELYLKKFSGYAIPRL